MGPGVRACLRAVRTPGVWGVLGVGVRLRIVAKARIRPLGNSQKSKVYCA